MSSSVPAISSSLSESFSPSFCLSSACLVRLSRMSSVVTLSFSCLVRGPEKPNRWRALGDLESVPNLLSSQGYCADREFEDKSTRQCKSEDCLNLSLLI